MLQLWMDDIDGRVPQEVVLSVLTDVYWLESKGVDLFLFALIVF